MILNKYGDFEFWTNDGVSSFVYNEYSVWAAVYSYDGNYILGLTPNKTLMVFDKSGSNAKLEISGWSCQTTHISSNKGVIVVSDSCG